MSLSDVQASQSAAVTQGYQNARYAATASVAGMTFPTDSSTQQNVMGYIVAYMAPNTPPATMPLVDASGAVQALTYAQLQALAATIATASVAAFSKLQDLLARIQAATTVEAVQQIQW